MLPEERKRQIVELVTARDGCTVEELSGELEFSETTIRRDLDELDRQNLVERTHGGAMPVVDRISDYERRTRQNREAKEAIAARAVQEIHEGQVVFFDAGSTTLQISEQVPDDLGFAAVTIHPMIAYELGDKDVDVQLTGGTFTKEHQILWGPLAEQAIERMHFDVAFFGTEGVDADAGLTTAYHDAARVKELVVENSRRKVLVADHTKFGTRNKVRFCTLSELDLVVTDEPVPGYIRDALVDHDVDVVDGLLG